MGTMTEANKLCTDLYYNVMKTKIDDEDIVQPFIYDRKGKNISLRQWKIYNEDDSYRQIGVFEMGDYTLSTMWAGVAHDGYRIFETVVFSEKDSHGFGIKPIFEEWCSLEEIAIGLHMILARSLGEIYESTPCPSEKKRLFLLALERLRLFLHPEEPEDDHIDEAE